ncbi:pancreatic lipase-related protein 2-like [Ylistrum balloti]|uniref:pancreatic lipase-related protein 2-like n=1 Tax=Ylistrum balloti TaxID=509963 RepID=UPI0029059C6D|nr:pancreatic lipase-related protein 2-like [Ylistrum balloti]
MIVLYFIGLLLASDLLHGATTSNSTTPVVTNAATTHAPSNANKTVCYPFVGCFDNYAPFDNANLDLPRSPDAIGTVMLLFTPEGGSQPEVLDYTNVNTVLNSHYNHDRKTKFIIHGFTNNINTTWMYQMKDELLKVEPMNVVVVAWGPGAAFPDYFQAVANTRMVGTQMRLMIDQMVLTGASLADFHLIGHSLGAHTSGYTGYLLHGKLARISGLDAAEPDFENHPKMIRLDADDAMFVDVIHTNGAPISTGGAGLMQQSGHVDFYVNGGETQPGCPSQISGVIGEIFNGNFDHLGDTVSCSHSRSHEVFTESINSPCPFTGYPCSSYDKFQKGACLTCGSSGCAQMGYYADQYHTRGKLYLNTESSTPYCAFQYRVIVSSSADSRGTVAVRLNGVWGTSGWHSITAPDVDLTSGHNLQKLVTSSVEVGQIQSIDLRYTKKASNFFGLFGGEDSWSSNSVSVTSGELGQSFQFCTNNRVLQDGTPINIRRASAHSC